jgi:hypothetical protein
VAINYVPAEEPDAQDLAELARKDGTKLVLLPGDITGQDFCKELVTNASSELGRARHPCQQRRLPAVRQSSTGLPIDHLSVSARDVSCLR